MHALENGLDAPIVQISRNTDQRMIVVTQDKILLCLKRNISKLGKREWIAPLSTVLTILLALITSDFQGALGLGPSEWRAIFVISGFITTGWLAYTLKKGLGAKNMNDIIYDIVHELSAKKQRAREKLA